LATSAEPPESVGNTIIRDARFAGAVATTIGTAGIAWPLITAAIIFTVMDEVDSHNSRANGDAVSVNADNEQGDEKRLTGMQQVNQWNYKETITTTFDWENLVCHKCVRSTPCAETKTPLRGNRFCNLWGQETELCTDTLF